MIKRGKGIESSDKVTVLLYTERFEASEDQTKDGRGFIFFFSSAWLEGISCFLLKSKTF